MGSKARVPKPFQSEPDEKQGGTMNFVISYSCGKDSTLALHRMLEAGHHPVGLLVMLNEEMDRSWFHGIDLCLLEQIAGSLGIPLISCICRGDTYHTALEQGLMQAKTLGAEACVFGDIDIEEHYTWCSERCVNTGIEAVFPLWQENRESIVHETVTLGYTVLIKCIQNNKLPETMLGKVLDRSVLEQMKQAGIDICGENGEYHSIVVDGPAFEHPVVVECREILRFGSISAINIVAKGAH